MKPRSKKIEIVITHREFKGNILKLVREFSNEPISGLIQRFKSGKSIYTKELVPEQFYSGVSDICLLLSKLDKLKVEHLLLINGLESSHNDINQIKESVENMSLSDFR